MSYSKISSIILWVVAGISMVVMIFFFIAENTPQADELDKRVAELRAGGTESSATQAAVTEPDSTMTDSSVSDTLSNEEVVSAEGDVASTEEALSTAPVTPGKIDLKEHLTGMEIMIYKRTDYALIWAYILLAIAIIAALVFPFINIITDVKAILRLLALIGGTAVLILVCYFVFASDQPLQIMGYTGTDNSNPVVLKWVDSGLFLTYILFGLAIISILYSEVVKVFK